MTGIPEKTGNIFLLFRDHWSFLRRSLAVRAFRVRCESLNSKQKQINYNITGSNKCEGFGSVARVARTYVCAQQLLLKRSSCQFSNRIISSPMVFNVTEINP